MSVGERAAGCSAADADRTLEYIIGLNWKVRDPPTDLLPFSFFGGDLSWCLFALSDTLGSRCLGEPLLREAHRRLLWKRAVPETDIRANMKLIGTR